MPLTKLQQLKVKDVLLVWLVSPSLNRAKPVNQSSFPVKICGHLRSGHYNVVWTGKYNVIVPARASIAESRPPCDAILANDKA